MIGRRRKRRFDFEINRTKFLLFCFFVVFSVVLSRLFYLQVVKGDEYHQIAISQRSSKVEIPARRGEILVKDPTTGELVKLATNTTLDLLYVDPFVTPDKKLVAEKLTPLLFNEEDYKECLANTDYCPKSSLEYVEYEYEEEDGVKIDKRPIPPASYDIALKALENDVFVKINKEDVDFVVLARALSVEHMDKIEKMNIYGIGLNKKGRLVYADPTKIPENQRKDIAKRLNEVLETDYDLLIRRLTGGKLRYVMLGRKLNPDVSEKIIEMKKAYKDVHLKDKRRIFLAKTEEKPIPDYFRGVALTPEHFRYYPDGALASQVIGFVNHEGVGQYGIEGKLNNLLSGKKGVIESQNDILGNGITSGTENIRDAENGASVVLTIDRIVQNHIEEILAEAVEKYRADSGQIVVMEPFTGDIIAMANYPTFDPNSFGNVYKTRRTTPEDAKNIFKTTPLFKKNDDDVLVRTTFDDFDKAWRIGFDPEFYIYENKLGPASYVNKTVQETYEPGSVFKPIAMAAGLDAREVTPSTRFLEDGPLEVGEFTIKTALNEYRGWQTMTNVIETSSNVGMAFVAEKLGRAVFYRYIMDFGFGKYTDIELENEVEGQVKYYKSWSDALLFTASYGQGITATPLQMTTAWCSLINGGILIKPHIISEIRKDGKVYKKLEPEKVRRVISAETSVAIKAILISSVENGVAHSAKIPGYKIGGKTGTSQIARDDGRGYEDTSKDGSVITTFGGFAPLNKPKFVVLVKFDRPRIGDNTWGSTTAGPVFKEIVRFLIEYYGIPPDSE